jgi:hypothetical protein
MAEDPSRKKKRKEIDKKAEEKRKETVEQRNHEDEEIDLPSDPSLSEGKPYREYFVKVECICADIDPNTDECTTKTVMAHPSIQKTLPEAAEWMCEITRQFQAAVQRRVKNAPKPAFSNPLL